MPRNPLSKHVRSLCRSRLKMPCGVGGGSWSVRQDEQHLLDCPVCSTAAVLLFFECCNQFDISHYRRRPASSIQEVGIDSERIDVLREQWKPLWLPIDEYEDED